MNDKKPCIYALHTYCIVEKHLREHNFDTSKWGSEEWIKLHCSMCVKAMYAKAKWKTVKSYTVVNTL